MCGLNTEHHRRVRLTFRLISLLYWEAAERNGDDPIQILIVDLLDECHLMAWELTE